MNQQTEQKKIVNNIIVGKHYRISVLTSRLIRLEYSEEGKFVDNKTSLVASRSFDMPEIEVKQDNNYLEIKSKYFLLSYAKEKSFKGSSFNQGKNLNIKVLDTDGYWYYGEPEIRNFYGTNVSIEDKDKIKLKKGLYAVNGFATIDDSESLIFDEESKIFKPRESKELDLYVFVYNKDFGLCLNDYFKLTGYPPMIPRYALGNWWCKDDKYSDKDINKLVNKFAKNDIPLSIFMLDKEWRKESGNGLLNYSFNDKLIPNPKEMIDNVHNLGLRMGLAINPQNIISSVEDNYNLLESELGSQETEFKFYDPVFLNAYYNKFIKYLEDLGVDFFFIDYLPEDEELNKLFLLDYYQNEHDNNNPNKRPMMLSRNSMIGGHRYPVLYSGRTKVSFDTLRMLPFYNLSSANMGISWWSHDIGGYYKGIEEAELYIRYVQLGVFSPILRFHAGPGKYVKREPWRWDIKTYKITQDYLKLRHRLIPYLYAEGYKYHKKGLPLVQPLYYRYPWTFDDVIYRNQYYLGSELLISPIYSRKEEVMNRTIHRFFIPEGVWYDFRTGKKFPGGKKYVSFYKDEDYPVFAKSGAIIPLASNEGNDITCPKNMEIHIFPGRSNTYNLFEDDGVTSLYKEGYYLLSAIDYNYQENNYTVIIRPIEGKSGIVPDKRNYKIRFRNVKKPDDVIVYFNSGKILSTSYVDDTDFVVEVNDADTTGQLTINCKGKDIEIDALRVINDDVDSILMDLPIETLLKEKISSIMFNDNLEIKKKRIEIRKLKRLGLDPLYVTLFIRLLEYINQI